MCDVGIKAVRTDEQLASELRRHLQALRSLQDGLNYRGCLCTFRSGSGYVVALPERVDIKKEVSL